MLESGALTDKVVSIIIPCFNESQNILPLYARIKHILERIAPHHEIIYIDNASLDDSESVFRELASRDKQVKVHLMSRNFQAQASLDVGFEHCLGDCAICLDGDQQDPPELFEEFIKKWLDGFEIVYGVRNEQEGNAFINFLRRIFYRLLKILSYIEIPLDAGDFALYDRRVVDILISMPERSRFLRGLRAWIGFRHTGVKYFRQDRAGGTTSQSLVDYFREASKGVSSFSYAPLELISWMAFLTVGLSVLGILIHIAGYFLTRSAPQGTTTIIVVVLFLGGIQLLSLSIIGGYLGKIFEEVKRRPKYILRESINSIHDRRRPEPATLD